MALTGSELLTKVVPIQGSGQLPANFIPAEPLTAA
jgi:hypothetical protein